MGPHSPDVHNAFLIEDLIHRNYRVRVLLDAGGVNGNLLPTLTPP